MKIQPESDYERILPDGRFINVYRQFFNAKVTISSPPQSGEWCDNCWDDAFEYPDFAGALAAAELWDGNGDAPVGWIRQPTTGRRRPNGDPSREYVEP